MANGILQVSPAPFTGERANSLPIYIPGMPVAGASGIWDSRNIRQSVGSAVSTWAGIDGIGPTLTPSGAGAPSANAPTLVSTADGGQAVRFVATNKNALGAALPRTIPNTVVVVGRFTEIPTSAGLQALVGSGTPTSGLGQILASTDIPRTYAGASLSLTGRHPGTGYHVFIAVFAGENSVIRMDGFESVGPAGNLGGNALSIASYQDKFSNIEVKKVAYYPFAMSFADREKTVAALAVG